MLFSTKIHWEYKMGIYLELPLKWSVGLRGIQNEEKLIIESVSQSRFVQHKSICAPPFLLVCANGCWPTHFNLEKSRPQLWERIDCWQDDDFGLWLQPFILEKVTYKLWGSRVRLLWIRFRIFGLHFVVHSFLNINFKFHLNLFGRSWTVMLQISAIFICNKSVQFWL